jgi:inosine-uridine nucleoside N-ribohydrolase
VLCAVPELEVEGVVAVCANAAPASSVPNTAALRFLWNAFIEIS